MTNVKSFANAIVKNKDIFESALREIYFKFWNKNFKTSVNDKYGISIEKFENTVKMINSGLKMLEKIKSENDVSKKMMLLNQVKNINHNTGSMLDYFEDEYGMGEEEFEDLSSIDTEEWEEELSELGVDLP